MDKTILGCLYHWEKTTPKAIHMVQPVGGGRVEELTWAQCMDQVRRMATYLKSLDFPAGSQIAIIGKNSAHWMLADWAIWMAGHVSVPIYPTLNAETVRYILEHSEAKMVFLGKLDDWGEMRLGVPADLPGIKLPLAPESNYKEWSFVCAAHEPQQGDTERNSDDMATIIYTSGSTGQPKGVMHAFRALEVVGKQFMKELDIGKDDRMLSYLPLAHVYERIMVETMSIYGGFCVYFTESLNTFPADLRRARPTFFVSVPRLWTKFQAAVEAKMPRKKQEFLFKIPILGKKVKQKILNQLGLDHVRYAATGSAPLAASTISWYRSLGLDLLEGYGMSEDMAYSHVTRPGESKIGYVGRPNEGVQTRIADNGEIQIKSPAKMLGYYKEPDKTAESFTDDGYFKTGDMGEYDDQGRLRITGRIKELFKISKGKYVAPAPIENKLMVDPNVEAVCVGGADQPATFALVLPAEEVRNRISDGSCDKAALESEISELLTKVNSTLDPHEQMQFAVIVKDVWTIEGGFLTPTMKIKRNVIEKHYAPQVDGWYASRKKVIWEA